MEDKKPTHHKDVAEVIEAVTLKINRDPAWGAGHPSHQDGNITVFEGDEFEGDDPEIGTIDVKEEPNKITVTIETLNVKPADVHVSLLDGMLLIRLGEGRDAERRDLTLSTRVDEENSVATFRNGVIDVVLPRLKSSA